MFVGFFNKDVKRCKLLQEWVERTGAREFAVQDEELTVPVFALTYPAYDALQEAHWITMIVFPWEEQSGYDRMIAEGSLQMSGYVHVQDDDVKAMRDEHLEIVDVASLFVEEEEED